MKTWAESMEELHVALADLGRAIVESPLGQAFVRFHRWEATRIGEPLATLATWLLVIVCLTWPPILFEAAIGLIRGHS
jgi:hypothetical protein